MVVGKKKMKKENASMSYSEHQEFEFLQKFVDEIVHLQDDFKKLIETYHPPEITMKRVKMKWVLPTWMMLFQESLETMINFVTLYEVKVFKNFNNQLFCTSRLRVVAKENKKQRYKQRINDKYANKDDDDDNDNNDDDNENDQNINF